MLFLAEWYAGAKIILYVDKKDLKKYMGNEHAYVISNHKYEIDWLMVGLLLEKNRCGGVSIAMHFLQQIIIFSYERLRNSRIIKLS